jgi:hypothetical protein
MSRIRIPENAGADFEILIARAGNYAVSNNKTGKNKVFIPCRDREQAEDLLRKLKEKDHDGEIWV